MVLWLHCFVGALGRGPLASLLVSKLGLGLCRRRGSEVFPLVDVV